MDEVPESASGWLRLPWAGRLALGIGLGVMAATGSSLAFVLIWPGLFVAGFAAGVVGGRFVPVPTRLSGHRSVAAVVALSVAMAATPYVRGFLYLRQFGGRTIPVFPQAEVVSWDYRSPLYPRFVSLEMRVKLGADKSAQAVFEYYDRQFLLWKRDGGAPPRLASWTDNHRNRLDLQIYPSGSTATVYVTWNRAGL